MIAPVLVLMLAWFGWHLISCIRLMRRLRGTEYFFVPAGLFGGQIVAYLQSCLEWVFRQQLNLICLMFMFAMISYLNQSWRHLVKEARKERTGHKSPVFQVPGAEACRSGDK